MTEFHNFLLERSLSTFYFLRKVLYLLSTVQLTVDKMQSAVKMFFSFKIPVWKGELENQQDPNISYESCSGRGTRNYSFNTVYLRQQHTSFSHVYNLSRRKSTGVIFTMFYSLLIEKTLESVINDQLSAKVVMRQVGEDFGRSSLKTVSLNRCVKSTNVGRTFPLTHVNAYRNPTDFTAASMFITLPSSSWPLATISPRE